MVRDPGGGDPSRGIPSARASRHGVGEDPGDGSPEAGFGLGLRSHARADERAQDGSEVSGAHRHLGSHPVRISDEGGPREPADAGSAGEGVAADRGARPCEGRKRTRKRKDGANGTDGADDRGRRRSDDPLRGRCDSFVVKTDVHDPTEVHRLWDAMRCRVRDPGRAAVRLGVSGWRQWQHGSRKLQQPFPKVRQTRRARPEPVKAYLDASRAWVRRAEETVPVLLERGVPIPTVRSVESYLKHARRQIHQVDRRLLKGEKIPPSEKGFSIFEEHTRGCGVWEGQGRGAGGTRSAGGRAGGSARLPPAPSGPVGRRRRGSCRAHDLRSPGSLPRPPLVQFRSGLSQPLQPDHPGRAAGAQRAAEEGKARSGGPETGSRSDVPEDASTASGRGVRDPQPRATRHGPGPVVWGRTGLPGGWHGP